MGLVVYPRARVTIVAGQRCRQLSRMRLRAAVPVPEPLDAQPGRYKPARPEVAPAREAQLDQRHEPGHRAAGAFGEIHGRAGGAAGGQDVINDRHPATAIPLLPRRSGPRSMGL